MKKTTLKLALISMKHRLGDIAFNLERHHLWIKRAARTGASFVGFPEFSLTGWTYDRTQALPLDATPLQQIETWAREYELFIGTCLTERSGKRLFNTTVIYGPRGRVGSMRKINLIAKEAVHYTHGNAFGVFDVAGCRMGIATCADATRYEVLHILSLKGAAVIFAPHANTLGTYGGTPSGWLRWRMERWPLFARDCGVVIAGVNNAGLFEKSLDDEQETAYCGGGAVIDWEGNVVDRVRLRRKKECMFVSTIDLAALGEARKNSVIGSVPLGRDLRQGHLIGLQNVSPAGTAFRFGQ